MAGKKNVPELRSGLRPSEKELPERRSGAFRHKNTPEYDRFTSADTEGATSPFKSLLSYLHYNTPQ
jgi:hypothetical protein